MWREKTITLIICTLVGKVMSLLFSTMSRFVIAFLPRSSCLLILWLWSLPTGILEPKKRKFVTASTFSPSICHEVMGPDAMILVFLIFSFKLAFPLSSFPLIKRFFSSSSFMQLEWYHPNIWSCWCFSHQSWFQVVNHPAQHFSWCAQCIS